MQLKFNEEEMTALISSAVLTGLGAEQRDSLIQQAVQHLLAPQKDHYGRAGNTPLQDAFNNALDLYVSRAMNRLLEEDEGLREKADAAARELLAAIGSAEADYDLRGKLAVTLIEHLNEKRRDF